MKPLGINTINTVKKLNFMGIVDTLKVVDSANDVHFVPIAETDDSDNLISPNTDYLAVLEWAAIDGNTIAEAD